MKVYIFQIGFCDSETIISIHKTREAAETLMGLYMEAEEKVWKSIYPHEVNNWGSIEEVEVLNGDQNEKRA